jgi:hypothetical protein
LYGRGSAPPDVEPWYHLTSLLYMYVDANPKRPEAVPETRIPSAEVEDVASALVLEAA